MSRSVAFSASSSDCRSVSLIRVPEQVGSVLPSPHRKTETSTLSYQKDFMVSACRLTSRPAPKEARLMAAVTITAMVIVRLRRRPMPISLRTNWARTGCPSGEGVDQAIDRTRQAPSP